MRRMLEGLADLPLPGADAGESVVHPVRQRQRRLPRALALAATLVLGVGLGFLLRDVALAPAGHAMPGVTLSAGGIHDVQVAFESPTAFRQVEFVVQLPPGVELNGHPGQRVVRWQGHLAEGRSRLRLPLRVMRGATDGQLVARIVHGSHQQELRIPLRIAAGQARVGPGGIQKG